MTSDGQLAKAFREAMALWDVQKASGMSFAERLKGLDALLRQVWPFTREWKYLCTACDDLGAIWHDCSGDATCGRHQAHLPHTFVEPCWCQKGVRFREKVKPSPEDFTAAGRNKPMARMGR